MRRAWWISISFLLASTVLSIETLPFTAPNNAAAGFEVLKILKRQNNNCPSGYNPCTALGDAAACCRADTICTTDAADNIACCPSGATCTGTLTATPASGSTATTSSSFLFVQSNPSATTSTSGPNAISVTGPTLTGAAYPFVVIPTTFADAATCSAYYSLCTNEYTSCTSALEGRYGVTVAPAGGGGGGVTVTGANPSNAASTCSSLSLEACHGLQIGYCATYQTAVAASNRAVSRPQKKFQDVVVGVAVGFAGMFI